MDFFQIATREAKSGNVEIFPDFIVGRSKDLMIRSRSVYAVWDEARGLWSTDEYDVQRLVDEELRAYAETLNGPVTVKYLRSGNSQGWTKFMAHVKNLGDNYHQLDENLTFANQEVKRSDYVSKRLPYSLEPGGDYSAWDEMMNVLYKPEDREKIEWCIGAIVSGDAKKIQKFLVFYGPAGTGKSTVLNIIENLFTGYTATFNAKDLGGNNNQFATEAFRTNPLVAIQHDGDLSRIEDNTKINSIVSHEPMTMNEKFKPSYTAKVNAFLLMGTNQPVKISDSKSGLLRRLIDVEPSGAKLEVHLRHERVVVVGREQPLPHAHGEDGLRAWGNRAALSGRISDVGQELLLELPPDEHDVPDRPVLQLHRDILRRVSSAELRNAEAGVRDVQGVLRRRRHRQADVADEVPGRAARIFRRVP
jgi:energy-coupling factor transporter ATP-binding protein EcfA2